MIDATHVQELFAGLRANRQAMRKTTAAERLNRLARLRAELIRRLAEIGAAINADLGRPEESRSEVDTVLRNIEKAEIELEAWMRPEPIPQSIKGVQAKRIYVKYESRGVVLLFGTWDFPIGMFFSPLVQAICAGNVVLAKTSDMAPHTGKVINEIVEAAFPRNEVAVINDANIATTTGTHEANDYLLSLPVDHIFLTGSPRQGKLVVAAAARHLTSFTLELGGKSPAIVDSDIDLDYVAAQLVRGKIYNHGQTCLSVDHLWVPEERRDSLVEKFVAAVKAAYFEGDRFCWERDGRFVNQRNYDRAKGYLDDAISKGAKVVFGGSCHPENLVIDPTVLVSVPSDAVILHEEVFAPILPVLTYTSEEQIFKHADRLGKPLGFYVYSRDDAFVQRMLDNTSSGGVTVNAHNMHWLEENLPFGGVNSSGYGRYHGVWGFRELSNARSVFHVAAG